MPTVLDGLRTVLGQPNLYTDGVLDYGALLEYFGALLILCITVASIFKIVRGFFK